MALNLLESGEPHAEHRTMSPAQSSEVDVSAEELSGRALWDAAVGRVFKLASKSRGIRTVTYTQVKAVRSAATRGVFEIEVYCAEITGRTLTAKRMYSNICKEGVLQQDATSELQPESFGTECPLAEFEKVTAAILSNTNSYLNWVMQGNPEEQTDIDIPIDLPHLKLTDMEASLVRNSPFIGANLYFVTENSIAAAEESIQQELKRASRGVLLTDVVDAAFVAQKNEALASLQAKLKAAAEEMETRRILASVEVQQREHKLIERRRPGFAALQLDSLTLALLGRASATTVRWVSANPSEEGPVYWLNGQCAPLEFFHWAHVSGSIIPSSSLAGRTIKEFFRGLNQSYTGPDHDGVYPVLKPAAEAPKNDLGG
jgi:hypothetical protein